MNSAITFVATKAATGYNADGLQSGSDFAQMRHSIAKLRRDGNRRDASVLETIAAAGSWIAQRACEKLGKPLELCNRCGKSNADLHMYWECETHAEEFEEPYEKSEHIVELATKNINEGN